ncbi:hypothetical protein LSTR_LSTR012982 [Laodelphax striatellus]|uniref:Exostosin GT47 domain-containing protein n=1 Tax=Laodelphax striatellus TaxID=195883 RepID=A0A482XK14_LAOST|nr:hypothetical protein LSTR_LSTR012982 [Laodelphax striatellus]
MMCSRYVFLIAAILSYVILNILIVLVFSTINKTNLIRSGNFISSDRYPSAGKSNITVEIWGKASISLFLWEHILGGTLKVQNNGMIRTGSLRMGSMTLNFKYGPWFIQSTVPTDVQHLILVLNGRSEEKIVFAKHWLDYLPNYSRLKTLIVILLGNEQCDNNWIMKYMKSNSGKIDVLFTTYDSPLVDDKEFYQWPLGVAVYRGFRNFPIEDINVKDKRRYLCNFVGTIYKNSSRSKLRRIVDSATTNKRCPIIGRKTWLPKETQNSLDQYKRTLEESDLTLCPVGQNAECYRIYEALSVGSMPIIEDQTTLGSCDKNAFRLLKKYNPPFLFIKDWGQLPEIIRSEMALPQSAKKRRRSHILKWYKEFKESMKDSLINVLKSKMSGT